MLIAQFNPDKAPQKSDGDREDVIDGHTHRQRLVDIFRLNGYFLQIIADTLAMPLSCPSLLPVFPSRASSMPIL